MRSLIGVSLLVGLAVTLGRPSEPRAQIPLRIPGWQLDGRALYDRACATCHGVAGDGKGPSARWLDTPPRDFTKGDYKFRSTPFGALPTDADLMATLERGVPGTQMPSYRGRLSFRERRAVIEYIKGFSRRFRDPGEMCTVERKCDAGFACQAGRCVLVSTPKPPPTAATVAQGRALYARLGCAQCHGPEGRGDGPAADSLKDDQGRKILPYDFTKGNYKGGSDPASIYRTFSTGLSGTPMPSFADAIASEDRWKLVEYVLSLSRERTVLDYLFADQPGRYDLP